MNIFSSKCFLLHIRLQASGWYGHRISVQQCEKSGNANIPYITSRVVFRMFTNRIGALWLTLLVVVALLAVPIGGVASATVAGEVYFGQKITEVDIGGVATYQASDDAHFAVEITDLNRSVVAGESVAVTAVVTNTGAEPDSQQIHLKNFDTQIVDSIAGPPLTLVPGEQQTVSLRWNTTTADVGKGDISIQSDDSYPSAEVTITPAPTLTSDLGSVDSTVVAGDTVTVPVNITNTGTTSATPTVWMARNGTRTDKTTVDVAPGTAERVTFTYTAAESDVGSWNLTAGIDTDHDAKTVTVTKSDGPESDSQRSTERSSGGSSPNVLDRQHATIRGPGTATFAGGDVRAVRFADDVDGTVVATRVRSFPAGVANLPSALERYTIAPPETATQSNATIQFRLSAGAVEAGTNGTLLVKRWNGTNWTTLPTDTTRQDGDLKIEATTTGFSSFGITTAEPPVSSTTEESAAEARANENKENKETETTDTQTGHTPLGHEVIIGGFVGLLLLVGYIGTKRI